jgi:phosphonate transport system substrate-binding protein
MYEGVIIVRKDAPMHSLEALAGKRFAFGSTDSTLSYYVPKWMLYRAGVYGLLSEKIFMGRHDRVLKQVVMGKADAGGVKASVAETMGDHIRVIARSEPIPDFAVVCRADLDPVLQRRIETALLSLKDPAILEAIKAGSVGFIPRGPTEYHYLRRLMDEVEEIDRRQRN